MWSLVVVNPDELIEAFLLLQEVERGGLGGLFFEGQVHTLVAAVLLRVSELDALKLMPRRNHQTESFDNPNRALPEAKGTPLSVRIVAGSPKSLKARSKTEKAKSVQIDVGPSQVSR